MTKKCNKMKTMESTKFVLSIVAGHLDCCSDALCFLGYLSKNRKKSLLVS